MEETKVIVPGIVALARETSPVEKTVVVAEGHFSREALRLAIEELGPRPIIQIQMRVKRGEEGADRPLPLLGIADVAPDKNLEVSIPSSWVVISPIVVRRPGDA